LLCEREIEREACAIRGFLNFHAPLSCAAFVPTPHHSNRPALGVTAQVNEKFQMPVDTKPFYTVRCTAGSKLFLGSVSVVTFIPIWGVHFYVVKSSLFVQGNVKPPASFRLALALIS
jgi:hypothetical protein